MLGSERRDKEPWVKAVDNSMHSLCSRCCRCSGFTPIRQTTDVSQSGIDIDSTHSLQSVSALSGQKNQLNFFYFPHKVLLLYVCIMIFNFRYCIGA